jgi:hypothetical protein
LCTPAGTGESEGGRRLGCRHAQHRGGLQEVFGSFIVHDVSHKQTELSERNYDFSGFEALIPASSRSGVQEMTAKLDQGLKVLLKYDTPR